MQTLDYDAEDMAALNNEDWKNIGKKIDAAIANALADLRPTGWANAVLKLRQIGTLANISAVFLALMAITIGALYQSFAHVKEETQFRTHTEDRLKQIEDTLLTIRASQSPSKVLQEVAKFQARQFSDALPAIQAITEHPVITVSPELVTLQEVAIKLSRVNEATPNYWSVTLGYIQWASAGMSPSAPPPGQPNFIISKSAEFSFGTVRDRIILLDEAGIRDTVFENCRIIFTGKPSVLKNITFINCVFEFPITNQPPLPLKQMGEQLLAEGIHHAVISLL